MIDCLYAAKNASCKDWDIGLHCANVHIHIDTYLLKDLSTCLEIESFTNSSVV